MVHQPETTGTERHHTVRSRYKALDAIFAPQSVAVIGATEKENSVGRTILWNLISSPFGGTVYPVNPKRDSVLGIKAYPSIGDVPDHVDLAVVVTPAPTVPGVIGECVDAGVRGAIIISAGFKERGPKGVELEQRIMEQARRGKMRIIGPNCLGVMRPLNGLNATFATAIARPGNVGFISQSGALCTSVLDWSFEEHVGFSAFISIGSMLDVNWGDLIDYLGDDPNTHSIVIYMETVGDARSFMSAAREVALRKPIIVIKAGRTAQAAQAAASHTGSLAGSDDVLNAAFERVGVLRVDRIADIFYMSEVLAKQPRPKGRRLSIVTNAGGPGVLATDSLILGGGELAELADETMDALNKLLPKHWSHNNPIDILGDAGPERYTKAVEIAINDPNSDALLVVLTPQGMTEPAQFAENLKAYNNVGKPVLASFMGGAEIAAATRILNHINIPTFDYPDTATRMFNYLWRYSENLRSIYETPVLHDDDEDMIRSRQRVDAMIDRVRSTGRTLLTEAESKQLLAAYNIPTTETRIAKSADEAVEAARAIGYPVVVKLHSETITHKTDVGGVKLNLTNDDDVVQAYRDMQQSVSEKHSADDFLGVTVQPMVKLDGYELIIGSSPDPQFGPVLLFGMGGSLVEVIKDNALGLPPLTTTLARRMMEDTKIYKALQGVRGRGSVDMDALESLMVRFSQLVVQHRWIKEIEINPLLASEDRLLALDARVVLYDADMDEADLPKPAIRPYPMQYVSSWRLKDEEETEILIRPIRPEDEPAMVKFHETLSERSVYLRYFYPMKLSQRIAHDRLARISFIDYDREMVFVAERDDDKVDEPMIIGVGRLTRFMGLNQGEFALLISDAYQGRGLGTELLTRLVEWGRAEGLERIVGTILADNIDMQRVAERVGFRIRPSLEGNMVTAELIL
ncbi:MAG: GNAT family N-acetyltransferase [Chloroflexi bacterium]|nr:MAG: GNAT family N-acetyltransferase [Chloroflexota bacterium]